MDKEELLSYLKNIQVVLISVVLFLFPLFFLTNTTDAFVFPKQIFLIFASIVMVILLSARMIIEKKVTIRSTPLNLPILLFGIVLLISSIISRTVYDSILQSVPVLAILLFYFIVINSIEDRNSFKMAFFSLLIGSALSSLIMVLHMLKIYVFPFPLTQIQAFNTFGSSIQAIMFMLPLFALCAYYIFDYFKTHKGFNTEKMDYNFGIYAVSGVLTLAGIFISAYHIIAALPQRPIILPFNHGFQIAFAAISQDTQRLFQTLLFGSGYGTFSSVFTRFRSPAFNNESDIWNLLFSYSSSYFLELIPTVGILGVLAFLFLLFKFLRIHKQNRNILFLALLIVFVLAFILPFSYSMVFLLFSLSGLYMSSLYLERKHPEIYNTTLSLVALRQGLLNFEPNAEGSRPAITHTNSPVLPIIFTVFVVLLTGGIGYFSGRLVLADLKFRESLDRAAANDANKTYNLQREAIATFPYRSDYYRIFSQINLALANSLANSFPQNSTPSAETQQTLIALIQQSIDAGRAATILSPSIAVNWQNLSQIYRNLINVGQNAEQFAIATLQQSIALDPYNPQLYVELGGIYYQLGSYELAQQQFLTAITLKRDFANAYYNLGHTLEAKNDLANAVQQYRVVRQLVGDNKESADRITQEITAIEQKLGQQVAGASTNPAPQGDSAQPPLELAPTSAIPPQENEIQIAEPPGATQSGNARPTPTRAPRR